MRSIATGCLLGATLCAFILTTTPAQAQYDALVRTRFLIQAAGAYEAGLDAGFWDVPGYNPSYTPGQNIQVWAKDQGPDRYFTFRAVSGKPGYYYMVPQHGAAKGARVEVAGGTRAKGANIQLGNTTGSDAQLFSVKYLPNGNVKIYNKNGMALCLANRSYENGSNVHTWEDHEGPWTEWVLIDGKTGTPFTNIISQPKGRVAVPEGYDIGKVEVFFYSKKYGSKSPLVTKPDASGAFSFPNASIDDSDVVAVLLAVGEGLASDSYQYHKNRRAGNIVLTLKEAPEGSTLFESMNRGYIPYRPSGYWVNSAGTITHDDSFFFRNLDLPSPEKKRLCELIGVSGAVAQSDEEIYEITRKTWEFIRAKGKNALGSKDPTVAKAFDECMETTTNGAVKYWPTIEQFVQTYDRYGFIPLGNCSSNALAFAAMLRTAGLPADKVAVERLLYDWYRDHWAVIVEMQDHWYWYDSTLAINTAKPFPQFDALKCIPQAISQFNYDMPFELFPVPGSTIDYVPYCGPDRGRVGF